MFYTGVLADHFDFYNLKDSYEVNQNFISSNSNELISICKSAISESIFQMLPPLEINLGTPNFGPTQNLENPDNNNPQFNLNGAQHFDISNIYNVESVPAISLIIPNVEPMFHVPLPKFFPEVALELSKYEYKPYVPFELPDISSLSPSFNLNGNNVLETSSLFKIHTLPKVEYYFNTLPSNNPFPPLTPLLTDLSTYQSPSNTCSSFNLNGNQVLNTSSIFDKYKDRFGPIVIDIDSDNIKFIELGDSKTKLDTNSDGILSHTAWISGEDGFLYYQQDKNNKDIAKSIGLKLWHEDAKTDLDGLKLYFDSNKDGFFNTADKHFQDFYIWQDANENARVDEGELHPLAELKIREICLTPNETSTSCENDSRILNVTNILYENGLVKANAYDIVLNYES